MASVMSPRSSPSSTQQFPGVPELADDIEQFMEVARAQHWIELA